jgi:hypothetical protein
VRALARDAPAVEDALRPAPAAADGDVAAGPEDGAAAPGAGAAAPDPGADRGADPFFDPGPDTDRDPDPDPDPDRDVNALVSEVIDGKWTFCR